MKTTEFQEKFFNSCALGFTRWGRSLWNCEILRRFTSMRLQPGFWHFIHNLYIAITPTKVDNENYVSTSERSENLVQLITRIVFCVQMGRSDVKLMLRRSRDDVTRRLHATWATPCHKTSAFACVGSSSRSRHLFDGARLWLCVYVCGYMLG